MNSKRLSFEKEPYVFASQGKLWDSGNLKWNIIIYTSPRDIYNMLEVVMDNYVTVQYQVAVKRVM